MEYHLRKKTNKGVCGVNQQAEQYDCFIHYYPPQGYSRLCERSNLITKRKHTGDWDMYDHMYPYKHSKTFSASSVIQVSINGIHSKFNMI